MAEWVEPLIQLTTAGGFGAMLWWVLVKHLPRQEQSHCERIDKIEQRHAEEQLAAEERHRAERLAFQDFLSQRDDHLMERMDQIIHPLIEALNQRHQ